MRIAYRLLVLAPLAALWATGACGEVLYVQSLKAKLFDTPSTRGTLVAVASRGDELRAVERQDDWIRVRRGEAEGWVSRLLVADHPPRGRTSLLDGAHPSLRDEARRRASAVATAGASRGLLTEGELGRDDQPAGADYRALATVERRVPDEQELADFVAPLEPGGSR